MQSEEIQLQCIPPGTSDSVTLANNAMRLDNVEVKESNQRHRGDMSTDEGSSCCSRFCRAIRNFYLSLTEVIPARYAFAIIANIGFFNVYAMRVNLSVAMVAMVRQSGHKDYDTVACPELYAGSPGGAVWHNTTYNDTAALSPTSQHVQFDWDSITQGQIMGAFFYGYVLTQIPGGLVAEKYGAKLLFGVGVLITALFTILTPTAAYMGTGWLMAVRIIEGLGEGVTFPAMNALIGRWVPKNERSRMSTIIFNGSPIGTVVGMALSGYIASHPELGWPMVFYFFGGVGCIWFVFWMLLIHESPDEHPRISQEELKYIQGGLEQSRRGTSGRTPWLAILTSGRVWALTVTHFGFNWGHYTLMTELPTYLSNILHFDIKQNGLLSAAPYLCQAIFAIIASGIADKMRASGIYRITTIRKIMNSVAFFIPCILVACVSVIGCWSTLIVALLILSVAFSGFMYSGFNVTHVDMSPEFAGTLMGITNGIANLSGFLAPLYAGYFTNRGQTLTNWGIIFITTSAIYIVTGFIYIIFASAELQPWGISAPDPEANRPDEASGDSRPNANDVTAKKSSKS